MGTTNKILSNLNLFLAGLLTFLFLFHSKIVAPEWIQTFGRMHAMLLHLPIGIYMLYLFISLFRKEVEPKSFDKIINVTLQLGAMVGLVSALFGLFLSTEHDAYNIEEIALHKNTGFLFAMGLYGFSVIRPQMDGITKSITNGLLSVILFLAGHKGAEITHGENYLLPNVKEEVAINENASAYERVVFPILEKKCVSCHNPQKTKGGLLMTDIPSIKKGGENGPIIIAGDADKSNLTKYIRLPLEDELHMSPKGKPQLTDEEIDVLVAWVKSGASFTKKVNEYEEKDEFGKLLTKFTSSQQKSKVYAFSPADEKTISELNTSFRTIKALNLESPALAGTYILTDGFKSSTIDDLKKIKTQLIHLNLSRMPIVNEDLKRLSQFENLEKLILNETKLTSISGLESLKKLESLSIMNSSVEGDISKTIGQLKNLKYLYLAKTKINDQQISILKKSFPNLSIIDAQDAGDVVKLTPPTLEEKYFAYGEEGLKLKHNIKGVEIKYAIDDELVDSLSQSYTKPIPITKPILLKARAYAKGWQASDTFSVKIMPKGVTPSEITLNSIPVKIFSGAGKAILTDKKRAEAKNIQDQGWIGFDNNFSAIFKFNEPKKVQKLWFGYSNVLWAKAYPPRSIEVYAGNTDANMKLVNKVSYPALTTYINDKAETQEIEFKNDLSATHYKVVIANEKVMPAWGKIPGQPANILIDEILFFEK
jgi:mono/diheme cytochrome c family protein